MRTSTKYLKLNNAAFMKPISERIWIKSLSKESNLHGLGIKCSKVGHLKYNLPQLFFQK